MKQYFYPTNILLPDFTAVNGTKWASVACDQYTSQPEYWEAAYTLADGAPSTLNLMLPEAFLGREGELIPKINSNMRQYLAEVLVEHPNTIIYLERMQSDGKVRRGLIGAIDLEDYDYSKGSETPIRATEGTVLERIPPRVAIRRGAVLEMPHIMVLIDDPHQTVIEPIAERAYCYQKAYDFDLMAGGGHVKGYFVDERDFSAINDAICGLASPDETGEKYKIEASPLLFAVGDGNHSLASAKALYEEIKAQIGEDALAHPARYALCEIVNLHDNALEFEPIYRVVFGVDPNKFVSDFAVYLNHLCGEAEEQSFEIVFGCESVRLSAKCPRAQLAVGTVQSFLDDYVKMHPEVMVDYIHGVSVTKELAAKKNTVGILFDGMAKDMLFKTVVCDGALPRKTFSMGHAQDKRFYLECRKIR